MICRNCGTENADAAKFCRFCGAPLAAEPKKPRAKSRKAKGQEKFGVTAAGKLILGIAAGIVVLALLIAGIASLAGGDRYPMKKELILTKRGANDETVFIVGSKLLKDQIDSDIYSTEYNYDGTKMMLLCRDNTLYLVTGKAVATVATDVYTAVFSAEGDTIAYVDHDDTLYLYGCGGKKTEKIAENVAVSMRIALSPDGKSVLYSRLEDGDTVLEVYRKNGETFKVGEGLSGIALSNDGKYIYSYADGNLYVSGAGKEEMKTLSSGVSAYCSILLNKDHSEIIFPADDKMYISKAGKEKQRISVSASSLSMVLPEMASSRYYARTTSYPVTHLLDHVFSDGSGGVYYINKKGSSDKIASGAYSLTLSDDGKTLYYLKNEDELKSVSVKNPSKVTNIADDVRSYTVSPDKTVYYVDSYADLWSRKGNTTKKIAGDVATIAVTQKEVLLFTDDRGTLYSSNGKDKKEISDGVTEVFVGPKSAYYVTKDALYAGNGNAKFKKLLEGLQ